MKAIDEVEGQSHHAGENDQNQSSVQDVPLAEARRIRNAGRCSGALEYHGFQHVGCVLGLVGGHFQNFEQFLVLDELNGIGFGFKETTDGGAADSIGFVLKPVNLDAVLDEGVAIFNQGRRPWPTPPPGGG